MTDREKLARQWAESRQQFDNRSERERAAAEYILATTTEPTMADVEWDDDIHRGLGAVDDAGQEWVMSQDDGNYINCIGFDLDTCGALAADLTPNGKRYELREVTKPDHPVEPSTKTMDEYSPTERADMVGMWAGYNRYEAGGEPEDFLIITGEETEAGRVPCYNPGAPIPHAWAPDKWMLTPRFDMPRAWGKDGEPGGPTVSSNENVGPEQHEQPTRPEVLTTLEDYENAPYGTIVAGEESMAVFVKSAGVWQVAGHTGLAENADLASTPRTVLRWGGEA